MTEITLAVRFKIDTDSLSKLQEFAKAKVQELNKILKLDTSYISADFISYTNVQEK